jgi:hypothetical protein
MGPPIVNGPLGMMGTVTTVGAGQTLGPLHSNEIVPTGPAPNQL